MHFVLEMLFGFTVLAFAGGIVIAVDLWETRPWKDN